MFGAAIAVAVEAQDNNNIVDVIERPRRVFRDRLDPLNCTDNELLRQYRFPRHTILELCEELEPVLGRRTARSHACTVPTQVLVGLRYLASASFQNVLGSAAGISQSSCSRILTPFIQAIVAIAPRSIRYPLGDAGLIARIKSDFYEERQFPNVIGCIDGTHIAVKAPSDDEANYVNRHGKHSINVQGICDSHLRLLNVIVQWPGSTHDSFIWRQSHIKQRLDAGVVPNGWLLGDSGYPLEPHLLTPVRNPGPGAEARFNESHMTTRSCIERCFGVLKSRFRCLHESGGTLLYSPEKTRDIIVAACVLHNWCVERNIPLLVPLIAPAAPGAADNFQEAGQANAGLEVRRQLIANRFGPA